MRGNGWVYLLRFLLCLTDAAMLEYFFSRQLGKHAAHRKLRIVLMVLCAAGCAVLPSFRTIFLLTLGMVILAAIFYGNSEKKLLLSFCLFSFASCWSSLFQEVNYQWVANAFSVPFFILAHAGFDAILYLMSRWSDPDIPALKSNRRILAAMLAFPAASLLWNISLDYYIQSDMSENEVSRLIDYLCLPVWCIFILLAILLVRLYFLLEMRQEELRKNWILTKQLELQAKHYADAEAMQKKVHAIRHDLGNELGALGMLLDDGNYEGARALLKGTSEKLKEVRPVVMTGNPCIDGILNLKCAQAEERKIPVFTDAKIPSGLSLDYEIMAAVFGNLMDNAMEACAALPAEKRRIDIMLRYASPMLMIKLSNPCAPAPDRNGSFETAKPDAENHGFGLSNTEEYIRRIGGTMQAERKENIFSVRILLYLQPLPADHG